VSACEVPRCTAAICPAESEIDCLKEGAILLAVEGMRPACQFFPNKVKGRLFAGHLITSRIEDLLPADRTQSLLVSTTWKGAEHQFGVLVGSWVWIGEGRTVTKLRSVLCRRLFAILAFRSVWLPTQKAKSVQVKTVNE